MQVSFDFGRRLWLGVGYAPHRTPGGRDARSRRRRSTSASPTTTCRRTGGRAERFTVLDGQVRLHGFGLDITGFRYDLSHRYNHPLLRITTFVQDPAAARSLHERRPVHGGAPLRDGAARHRGRAVADARGPAGDAGSVAVGGSAVVRAPAGRARSRDAVRARGRRRRATSASSRRRRWKGTS